MTEHENQNDREHSEQLDERVLAAMFDDFMEESREHLEQLNLNLTRLEKTPHDEELIHATFRIAHSLKGTAGFLGLDRITRLSHKMENVFGAVREKSMGITAGLIDIMFEGLDLLKRLRSTAGQSSIPEAEQRDFERIIEKLDSLVNIPGFREKGTSRQIEDTGKENNGAPTINSPDSNNHADLHNLGLSSIRVPIGKLDRLVNLIGELITGRNRLGEFSGRMGNDELENISMVIERLTTQLQTAVMSARMVTMERLFIRFPPLVRNLAREKNKLVFLEQRGKETELDKKVIEQLHDPLVHLLRNAIDHGIESPEQRRREGKSETGRITLTARHGQHNVIIEVSDDGRGLDPERIKIAAIEKKVVSSRQVSEMTQDQILRLIFVPGFTTHKTVSDISGRGVGMDVVKESVQKLRGHVELESRAGFGTTFRMRIPLTLAIIQALLVKAGGKTYALPLHCVRETLLIEPGQIHRMENQKVVFIREEPYPIRNLGSIMGVADTQGSGGGKLSIVVVGIAEKRFALLVDELLENRELVMKSVGPYLGQVRGIEGASILPDGDVTLVLDVDAAI